MRILTSSIFYTLEPLLPPISELHVLQRLVHLVWAVTIGVEPVLMVPGGLIAPTEIHWGVEPTYFISYGIFGHTHTNGRDLPVGILCKSLVGK